MTNPNDKPEVKEPLPEEEHPEEGARPSPQIDAPAWETELDTYPLRPPSEDPRWAVRTVGCWVAFALFSLAGILALVILGAIYD
jgi:hypothetical protein